MAPPFLLQRLAPLLFTLIVALALQTTAATFPLEIPKRPTSFPLQRPTLAGEVVAWGDNSRAQINIPEGLTNVVAISTLQNHTLVLKSDGTVVAWGDNQFGQIIVPLGLSGVVAVSAGGAHSVALKSDGKVVAWGLTNGGASLVPSNLPNVVAIAAGSGHTIALKPDGTIVGWGSNFGGEASPPTISSPAGPVVPTNVVAIAAGNAHSMALLADNRIVAWPGFGERAILEPAAITMGLGNDLLTLRRDGIVVPPNLVPLNERPVALKSGYFFALALRGDGSVALWRSDVIDGTLNPFLSPPPRLRGVIAIAAGENHAVAIKLPSPPIPTTARASAQIVNGFIVALNILDGGEGYAELPQVNITGGGGSGATATAQISRGVVTGFTITNAGLGYTSQPEITIDPPPFLPKLAIAPSRVNVTMQVVPGKRYQLESSDDLPNFSAIGAPFTAAANTITNEFTLSETGQFFRIQEVP
jgi:hypothetical protein